MSCTEDREEAINIMKKTFGKICVSVSGSMCDYDTEN